MSQLVQIPNRQDERCTEKSQVMCKTGMCSGICARSGVKFPVKSRNVMVILQEKIAREIEFLGCLEGFSGSSLDFLRSQELQAKDQIKVELSALRRLIYIQDYYFFAE